MRENFSWSSLAQLSRISAFCILLPGTLLLGVHGGLFSSLPHMYSTKRQQLATAKALSRLPADASIFGIGWWKAPALSLLSGRDFLDFRRHSWEEINALPKKYFVIDEASLCYATSEITEVLGSARYRTIFTTPSSGIYELLEVAPYAPFSASERAGPDIRPGFRSSDTGYGLTRGIYQGWTDQKYICSAPEAGILLRRSDQRRLRLELYFPEDSFKAGKAATKPVLSITSADCLNKTFTPKPGPQTYDITLQCPTPHKPAVMEFRISFNGHRPYPKTIEKHGPIQGFLFKSAELL